MLCSTPNTAHPSPMPGPLLPLSHPPPPQNLNEIKHLATYRTRLLVGLVVLAVFGLTAPGLVAAQTVTLSLSKERLIEADPATAITVTATLSAAQSTDTAVALSLGGTAVRDTDYTATWASTSTITIAANATSNTTTLSIDPTADTTAEGGETIIVQQASSGTLTVTSATLTLFDDWTANDRAALVAFYDATSGDNWTNKTNWKSDKALKQWTGIVRTDDNGRVQYLRLSNNNLSGTLPKELGNLDQLTEIHLQSNNLSGTLPKELGNLDQLTEIRLQSNNLSGPIPDLSALTALEELNLSANQLSGSIPDLSALTALTILDLSFNLLSGSIPDLSALTDNLGKLLLDGNQLTGDIPTYFKDFDFSLGFYFDYNESVCLPDDDDLQAWYNAIGGSRGGSGVKDKVEVYCDFTLPTAPTLTPGPARLSLQWVGYNTTGFTTSHYEVQYRAGTTGKWKDNLNSSPSTPQAPAPPTPSAISPPASFTRPATAPWIILWAAAATRAPSGSYSTPQPCRPSR